MPINDLVLSYPDFRLSDLIDPEQFDMNNGDIKDKINAILVVLNKITDSITDGSSGADTISLTAITPFTSTKLQTYLEEVITRLKSTTDGVSGADLIASTSITGVTGSTVQAQLKSLKSLFDALQVQCTSNTNAIGVLQTRATNVEGRATGVEGRATNLESRATNLESRATGVEGRATSLESRATNVEGRATTLESRATVNETNTSTNASNLTAHKSSGDHDARYYQKGETYSNTQTYSKQEVNAMATLKTSFIVDGGSFLDMYGSQSGVVDGGVF